MEMEILKLIYDYSVNGRLVDSKFIDKLIEIIVTNRSLNNYVKTVAFTDKLDKDDYSVACAAYGLVSKSILIDYESIKMLIENRSEYDCLFNDLEQIMFRNLMITQIILHELEHAYQSKQADNKQDNSIEGKLVKASFVLEQAMKNPKFLADVLEGKIPKNDFITYLLSNIESYKKYYALNPSERFAQVNSFGTIIKAIEPIKKHLPNLYEYKYASLVEAMLNGYVKSWDEGICPTQVYLYGTRQSEKWNDFDFYSQDDNQLMKNVSEEYSLVRRLSLGLPISYSEYQSTDDWLHSTNKFSI